MEILDDQSDVENDEAENNEGADDDDPVDSVGIGANIVMAFVALGNFYS